MDMPFYLKLAVLIIILLAEFTWLLRLIKKIGQGLGLLKPDTPPIETHHWHYNTPSFDEEAYKQRLKAQFEAESQRHREATAEAPKPQQWRDVSPEKPRLSSPIKLLQTRRR